MEINKNILTTDGKKAQFSRPISQVIKWNDLYIVRLEVQGNKDDRNNLIALRGTDYVWQVQDFCQFNPLFGDHPSFQPGSYVDVVAYWEDESLLLGTTFSGWRYLINPKTGAIVRALDDVH